MKTYSSKELIKILEQDGWELKRIVGSHHHFKHPMKPGTVTVPHPRKDLKPGTLKSILKQAGIE
jgi:predicted RNA binding protein YcfA (HicA-like mRNA interferase family)